MEVGGRKIEQEAEADTADDQAREHDLVNTSAPMPANPLWRVLIVVGSLHAATSDRHGAYAHIMRCLSCVWADGHSFRASSKVWTWWHCKGFVLKLRLMFLVLISAPRTIMLSSGATARAGTPTNHVELPSYCDTNACGCNGFVRCTHHLNSWQGELGPCASKAAAVTCWSSLVTCPWSPQMPANDKLSTLFTP